MLDSYKTQPTPEQMKVAFEQIATMANCLKSLCDDILVGEDGMAHAMAAISLAARIGWTADRCIGFTVIGSDNWMLPPNWKRTESEAAHA